MHILIIGYKTFLMILLKKQLLCRDVAYIKCSDGKCDKLFDACGKMCSNYEEVIIAIESA